MKQKITTLLLCLAMALSLCTFLSFGALAEGEVSVPAGVNPWDGTAAAGFAGGNGVEGDPYIIKTAEQLAYWKDNADTYATAYIELAKDIDLGNRNWSSVASFSGNFNGNSHTIYNMSGSYGFFKEAKGTISNVNFANAQIGDSSALSGSKRAILVGGAIGTLAIENCNFYNCDIACSSSVAIVVGDGNKKSVTISNVTIDEYSSVQAKSQSSAFVGYNAGGTLTFKKCTNYANVTGTGDTIGGYVGYVTQTTLKFYDCFNYGVITAGGQYAGGFVAYRYNTGASFAFYNCANYGAITATTNYAGGFWGYNASNVGDPTIKNCANYGTIQSAGKAAGVIGGTGSGGVTMKINGFLSVGTVIAGDGASPALIHTWADRSNTSTRPASVKNFYYIGSTLYVALTTGSSTKFDNTTIGTYNADTTIDALNATATANSTEDIPLSQWGMGLLPGSTTENHLQLSNAPHLQGGGGVIDPDNPPTEYTVTFLDANGEVAETQNVYEGFPATAPEVSVPAGYEVIGWVDAQTEEAVDISEIYASVTVKPVLQIKSFEVTFYAKDGTTVLSTQTVTYGQAATAPAADQIPSIESFEFIGWSVDFSYVTEDLEVVAKYSYTGTYFGGGYGTEDDPFLIKNAEQLRDIATKIAEDTEGLFAAGYYKLMADIDLAGENWTPISTFSGTFDGNGHVISNLYTPSSGSSLGFITKVTGDVVFSNLTFKDAKIATDGAANASRGVFVGTLAGNITFNNCHVINGQARGNSATIGLFVGSANISGAHLNAYNCTVSGSMTGSGYTNMGGFFGGASGSGFSCTSVFENCISYITLDTGAKNAGGFIGGNTQGGSDTTFINCIFAGSLKTSQGNTGGFMGTAHNYQPVTFSNSASYGTIRANGAAGGFIGDKSANVTLKITDCAVYGTIYSSAGFAGGVAAAFSGSGSVNINGLLVMATIEAPAEEKGAGAVVGKFLKKSDKYANIFTTMEVVVGAYGSDSDMAAAPTATILTSLTTLPEGLSSDVWAIGAVPVISGASVSFGGSVALNVYAEYGIVLKAHAADTLFVDGKAVAYANKVVLDGKTYAQFAFDGIKMADIETKYALSLMAGIEQMEYSVFTYITNTYAEADAALQNVLVALLCYGNAAQAEPTAVANAIVAIPELEAIVADYVEANYANVALTPVQSEGLKVGFNLYGFVQPVFKVSESITKATVTVGGVTSELVLAEGYAFYYDLSMLAINEEMTVTFYEGENVALTASYAVANYITEGIAGDTLTDAEKTLCKALAVFADAVAEYANN